MPIELPGRNSRMMEPKQRDMKQMVKDIVDALLPCFDEKPYALVGHSLGAWIVYEVAKELERRGARQPLKLYVCCNRAPHLRGPSNDPDTVAPALAHLPPAEFWTHMERRYGRNPELQKESIRSFVLPVLQADFGLLEEYEPSDAQLRPLGCPLAACGGVGDNRYTAEQLKEWRQHTSGHFSEHWFEGSATPGYWGTSHRFVIDNAGPFQEFLTEDLPKLYEQAQ